METPEPMGKLDAAAAVNGPEGDVLDWDSVDWSRAEDDVRRLRQRIFTASKAGDLNKVRNLQKLMLRSRANALVSVRRVTEVNAGRKTAGVDGRVVLAGWEKAEVAAWLQHGTAAWRPRPVKRVFIPKSGGKQRGLGIPVIADRALQARTAGALEPEWEARFESRSYGFRPGRSCQDAMQAVFVTARGKTCKRVWALDADLAAAFDRIDHSCLLGLLGTFPARGRVEQWLKAGVLDRGRFAPTEQGCPQGGVISPVLMNVILHGMEEAAGVRYHPGGHRDAGTAVPGSPVLIRYADDALALCHSRDQAEQVKARLAAWLKPRGLAFNEAKTAIVCLDDGVDFLGFNVRRYRGKLLIKPSKAAVKRIKARLTAEMKALRGHNAQMVLLRLNPIIRGWSAYYRHCVSARVFNQVDDHLWQLTYKWAKWTHPHKGKRWIASRYFGRFVPSRQDRWVFGDRDSGAYLLKFAWTKITRHTLVKGWASPDDPALASYWAARRRRGTPPLDPSRLRLLKRQHGRCPLCGHLLLHADREPQHPDEWEQWIKAVRAATRHQAITLHARPRTPSGPAAPSLIHTHCRRRLPDGTGGEPALPQT
jgi:RNA-directed DNA polymerase